jgi:hypothetical protein
MSCDPCLYLSRCFRAHTIKHAKNSNRTCLNRSDVTRLQSRLSFHSAECYTGTEFMCQNQRCIPLQLQCDGFNHCGDNSDEPEECSEQWENSLVDKRWYSHTPNYYFPKNDRFPDFRSTTMAFALSSCSLLLVISCLIMVMYRNGNRVREQEELQNQLQTISQLLGESRFESYQVPGKFKAIMTTF